jgi:DNA (cytosine-5)-methyltransferase 1
MSSYPEILRAAWADHLKPRAANAPTVVSTFAGCGGSSLGYSMAGFRELLAVEWDAHAAEVFRTNFPEVPVFQGDIGDYDPATLGLARGELDVFDGSPPCQGFSTAGKRQIDDDRNQLFRQYVRLIDHWHPKVFVMENVSGMIKGKMKVLFAEIMQTLRAAGPGYHVDARLVTASQLGVPQIRQRMIFVGVRMDLNLPPAHPAPTHRLPVTCRQAWEDMPDLGAIDEMNLGDKYRKLVSLIPPGDSGSKVLASMGKKPSYFNTARLHYDRPSFTILKNVRPNNGFWHPDMAQNRRVSGRELSRLQSFPDEFDWGTSSYMRVHERIGNSVPPLLMRAVARTIRTRILAHVGSAAQSV